MSSATQPQNCAAVPGDAKHKHTHAQAAFAAVRDPEAARLWRAAVEERDAGRRHDALFFYEQAAPLVGAHAAEPAATATFSAQFADLLAQLGEEERREDYTDRALAEYAAAARGYEHAGDAPRQAEVAHRHARLLVSLERTAEAHAQLDRARALFGEGADSPTAACLAETRARVLLAEARDEEAAELLRRAVEMLEESGASALLSTALTTRGVALARLGRVEEARDSFRRAEASAAGERELEGMAALALVEELCGRLPLAELTAGFERAASRLAPTPSLPLCDRLCAAARRVISHARAGAAEHSWEGFSFRDAVHRFEGEVIARALADAGGSVSRAAHLLGFRHHNSLASILNNRHRELLAERSPIKPRRRSIITVRERQRAPRFAGAGRATIVLHVEDDAVVAEAVRVALEAEGCRVEACADGADALSRLQRTAPYDLLILDHELPGLSGLDLTRHVRALAHRRHLPVIIFSAADRADDARAAGADLFLRKPQDAPALSTAVRRVLAKKAVAGSQ